MFGIGSTELLVIFVVALIVLGPKSIPQIAKTLGKAMGEFKRVSTDFQRTMNAEVENEEHEKRKKQAEEELFGKDKAGTAAPSTAAAEPVTATVTAEHTTDSVPAAAKTVGDKEPVVVSPPAPENTDTFAPDSPLAKAVAKAEAEAGTTGASNSASTAAHTVESKDKA